MSFLILNSEGAQRLLKASKIDAIHLELASAEVRKNGFKMGTVFDLLQKNGYTIYLQHDPTEGRDLGDRGHFMCLGKEPSSQTGSIKVIVVGTESGYDDTRGRITYKLSKAKLLARLDRGGVFEVELDRGGRRKFDARNLRLQSDEYQSRCAFYCDFAHHRYRYSQICDPEELAAHVDHYRSAKEEPLVGSRGDERSGDFDAHVVAISKTNTGFMAIFPRTRRCSRARGN